MTRPLKGMGLVKWADLTDAELVDVEAYLRTDLATMTPRPMTMEDAGSTSPNSATELKGALLGIEIEQTKRGLRAPLHGVRFTPSPW